MWELIRQSARHRLQRLVILAMGALLVTGGLAVLVGQLNQMRAQVQSVVELGNASSYDLLVRPRSTEPLAGYIASTGMAGGRGGITQEQLNQIRQLKEVAIAAPLTEAMVLELPVLVPQPLPHGLYRATWSVAAVPGAQPATGDSWLWLLPTRLKEPEPLTAEELARLAELKANMKTPKSFWQSLEMGDLGSIPAETYERAGVIPVPLGESDKILLPVTVGVRVVAIDPAAEAALTGLDQAVTAGRYLAPQDTGTGMGTPTGQPRWSLPVLSRAAEAGGFQIQVALTPAGLGASPTEAILNDLAAKGGAASLSSTLPASSALTWSTGSGGTGAYLQALLSPQGIQPYWQARAFESPAPPVYEAVQTGVQVNSTGQQSWGDLTGPGYRAANQESVLSTVFLPQYVGTYDPARLGLTSASDPLALLYQPGGQASDFPGALVQGAPPLITTLEAVKQFLPAAPIGSIRVKAAGDDVDSVMRAGKAIEGATGLQVQIMRGAAMRPVQVGLGTNESVTLLWPQLGAFLDYTREVERGDLAVLGLVAIVGLLFILATAIVHVLLRGKELATLAALGWRRNSLLVLVGVEAAAVGGTGGLLALLLLRTEPALVAAGLTLLIYTLGALVAAALSGVGRPGLSLRSGGVTPHPSLAHVDSIRGSAWATFRARRRNLLILLAIALPTALLLAMTGIASHLEEPLFVDLAGAQVMVSLRPLHWGAVAAAFVLAAGTAADLIALSVTERRGELAILRAIGWRANAVSTHVIWEGALAGLAAGLLGLVIGSGMLYWAFGRLPDGLWLQIPIVLCVPVLTGLLGALLPARWAARLQTAQEVKGL